MRPTTASEHKHTCNVTKDPDDESERRQRRIQTGKRHRRCGDMYTSADTALSLRDAGHLGLAPAGHVQVQLEQRPSVAPPRASLQTVLSSVTRTSVHNQSGVAVCDAGKIGSLPFSREMHHRVTAS